MRRDLFVQDGRINNKRASKYENNERHNRANGYDVCFMGDVNINTLRIYKENEWKI
nr:hypothetical protein [uncultured Campylobacter sp.]